MNTCFHSGFYFIFSLLFNSFSEGNLHTIKFTCKVHRSVILSEFMELCIYHLDPVLENFQYIPKFPVPLFPIYHSQATSLLLSVSIDMPFFFEISCKQNHTICGLLCLASFSWHNIFEVHPCCSMYQQIIRFIHTHTHTYICRIVFYCMDILCFVYPLNN